MGSTKSFVYASRYSRMGQVKFVSYQKLVSFGALFRFYFWYTKICHQDLFFGICDFQVVWLRQRLKSSKKKPKEHHGEVAQHSLCELWTNLMVLIPLIPLSLPQFLMLSIFRNEMVRTKKQRNIIGSAYQCFHYKIITKGQHKMFRHN